MHHLHGKQSHYVEGFSTLQRGKTNFLQQINKGGDKGLVAKTSFRFLVTGKNDDEYQDIEGTIPELIN